ncbi:MAG: Spy/CpxP family protein refolding chaperone [Pseudomonadota bacterium]|nr:Spy/CpxP family protein refolding chaperone [Pseudomonadota bacterium]
MRKLGKAIIVSTLLAVASGAAYAGGRDGHEGHHGHHGHHFSVERMAEKLDLSAEQTAAVRGIVEGARPTFEQYHASLREKRQQLQELARSATADEAAIRALADEQGDIMANMIVERIRVKNQIRALLTPEQQAEAEKWLEHSGRHKGSRDKDAGH